MSRPPALCTIGHSTRSIAEFVALLRLGKVQLVADIRSIPRSRRNPDYNSDTLPELLAPFQLGYVQILELGGLRPKSKTVAPKVNGFWSNQSFHNYADHAMSGEFQRGLGALIALNADRGVAIMCSEAVWWRCHRRIVSDYLLLRGFAVGHLMDARRVTPAIMTSAARPLGECLVYPAPAEA